MTKKAVNRLGKQYLRDKISKISSYAEVYLSILVIIGILVASLTVIEQIKDMTLFVMGGYEVNFQKFLTHAIELIIGVEFVKMLAKHTPGSAMDVLLFAIARKLIINEAQMLDSLLGVVAIALLFAVKKYLTGLDTKPNDDEFILNGGTSIDQAKKVTGIDIPRHKGNTLAGVVTNLAKESEGIILPGYELKIEGTCLQVYSMDGDLIKQVLIKKAE